MYNVCIYLNNMLHVINLSMLINLQRFDKTKEKNFTLECFFNQESCLQIGSSVFWRLWVDFQEVIIRSIFSLS